VGKFTTIVLHLEPEDPRLIYPLVEGEPQGTHPILLEMKYSKFPQGDVYYLVDWGHPSVKADNVLIGSGHFWELVKEAYEEGRHVFITHSMFQITDNHVEVMEKLLNNNEADIVSFPHLLVGALRLYTGNAVSVSGFAIRNELLQYVVPDTKYKVSTYYIDLVFQVLKHANNDKIVSILNQPLHALAVIKSPYALDYALYRIADGLYFYDKWDWWDRETWESPIYPHVASLYDLMVTYSLRKTGGRYGEETAFAILTLLNARDVLINGYWEALIPVALYLMKVKGTLRVPTVPPTYMDELRKAEILNYVGKRLTITKDYGNPDVIMLRGSLTNLDEIEEAIDMAKKAVIIFAEGAEDLLLGKYLFRVSPFVALNELWLAYKRGVRYFTLGGVSGATPHALFLLLKTTAYSQEL
jgi:hypothetical protein